MDRSIIDLKLSYVFFGAPILIFWAMLYVVSLVYIVCNRKRLKFWFDLRRLLVSATVILIVGMFLFNISGFSNNIVNDIRKIALPMWSFIVSVVVGIVLYFYSFNKYGEDKFNFRLFLPTVTLSHLVLSIIYIFSPYILLTSSNKVP